MKIFTKNMYRRTQSSAAELSTSLGLSAYLSKIKNIPLLSKDEEETLMKEWICCNSIHAVHKLVVSHLKLVVKIAFRFKSYDIPMMDLISEGNIGLMRSVKKFQIAMGCRLATYATWWIRASIQSYILKSWSILKVNTSSIKKKLFCNVEKSKQQIIKIERNSKYKNEFIDGEASRLLNDVDAIDDVNDSIDIDLIDCCRSNNDFANSSGDMSEANMMLTRYVLPLDEPMYTHNSNGNDGAYSMLNETIPDDDIQFHDKLIASEEFKGQKIALYNALKTLSLREQNIILHRMLYVQPTKLKVLADMYKISPERVRQIEVDVIKKLRKKMGIAC